MVATADGATLLLTHPASTGARRNMSLFSSPDGGASWKLEAILDPGPSQYSTLVMLPNGSVGLEWDSGCQNSKNPSARVCDKSPPTHEAFAVVTL